MTTRDFNTFVVACGPIARSEVMRLKRRGVWIDAEDGVQGALLDLLENEHLFKSFDGALARLHIRHRLINAHVQRSMAKKRRAFTVPLDEARRVATASFEDEVIMRVDSARLLEKHPLPKSEASRQAVWQAHKSWANRVRNGIAGIAPPKWPNLKLNDELVREIRASSESAAAIARRLRVSASTVHKIRRGVIWTHVAQKPANDNAFINRRAA